MTERQAQRRRSVRFSHSTQLFFVDGIWEYSEEEKAASWLTEEDNISIQRSTLKVVKRMRKGNLDPEKYCIRGLEHMRSSAALEERKVTKRSVIHAVLAEQRRLKESSSGQVDPVLLCQVSANATRASRESALRLGASDAEAAGASTARDVCSSDSDGASRAPPGPTLPTENHHATIVSDPRARAALRKTPQGQEDDDKSERSWSLAALARRGFAGRQQGGSNDENDSTGDTDDDAQRRAPPERRQSFDKLINTISLQFSHLDAEAKHTAEEIKEKQRSNSKTRSS